VGFVVDKVALEQVSSEFFNFHCKFSFHQLLHTHHHLLTGAGTIDQVADGVPIWTHSHPTPKNKKKL
jgi:hypothetical protein